MWLSFSQLLHWFISVVKNSVIVAWKIVWEIYSRLWKLLHQYQTSVVINICCVLCENMMSLKCLVLLTFLFAFWKLLSCIVLFPFNVLHSYLNDSFQIPLCLLVMQYISQVIGNVIYKLHETYPDYREVFNFVSLLVKTEIFYNTNLKQCISLEQN